MGDITNQSSQSVTAKGRPAATQLRVSTAQEFKMVARARREAAAALDSIPAETINRIAEARQRQAEALAPMFNSVQIMTGLQASVLKSFDTGIFDSVRRTALIAEEILRPYRQMNENITAIARSFNWPYTRPLSWIAEDRSEAAQSVAPSPVIEMPTIIVRQPRRVYANFGFEILVDGRFLYKGRPLKSLYHTSKHGKLLVMLVESPFHYVTDQRIQKELDITDFTKGVSNLMYELQDALSKDGIKLKVHRHRNKGYTLEGAKYPVKRS